MTQPQPFMAFNQEIAEKSGSGGGIQDGGPYVCDIESVVYTAAGTGSHGAEFTIKTVDGLSGKYIKTYFAKADGSPIGSGQSLLNALMGFTGQSGLSWISANLNGEQVNVCPELQGKRVGLFLQKRLYNKADGSEAYSFDIRCPFDPQTRQTFKEKAKNEPAKAIDRMAESYKDNDERSKPTIAAQEASAMPQGGGYGQHFSADEF